jgi:hypothetical protein
MAREGGRLACFGVLTSKADPLRTRTRNCRPSTDELRGSRCDRTIDVRRHTRSGDEVLDECSSHGNIANFGEGPSK